MDMDPIPEPPTDRDENDVAAPSDDDVLGPSNDLPDLERFGEDDDEEVEDRAKEVDVPFQFDEIGDDEEGDGPLDETLTRVDLPACEPWDDDGEGPAESALDPEFEEQEERSEQESEGHLGKPSFDLELPTLTEEEEEGEGPGGELALNVEPDLPPTRDSFETLWASEVPTLGLLPGRRALLALTAQAIVVHSPDGVVEQRWQVPEHLSSAIQIGEDSAADDVLLAVGRSGRLYRVTPAGWTQRTWPDERTIPRQITTLRGRIFVQTSDRRWFEYLSDRFEAAFAGRRLRAICKATNWVGIEESDSVYALVIGNQSLRPLTCDAPLDSAAKLWSHGETVLLRDAEGCFWHSLDGGRSLRRGSKGAPAACLGSCDQRPVLWTTQQTSEEHFLLETDLQTRATHIAATLPWSPDADDAPLVTHICWDEATRRLSVASDAGLLVLRRQ